MEISTCYVKMETFTENVVAAIRTGNMQDFRRAYRSVDVLIVDDVHTLSKKTATQEEFFHTFNTLHTIGKQIVLSANCAPAFLQEIEPRLISRFEWGIALPPGILNKEELIRMIEGRLSALEFPLNKKVIEFLLETFSYHLKSLHKAIEALVLRAHTAKHAIKSITLRETDVKEILKDLIDQTKQQLLNPQKIVQSVAEHYGIKSEDILGKSQSQDCALPRQIAMYLCRHRLKMPYTQIGQFFKRDHSTVISSVNNINDKKGDQESEMDGTLRVIGKKLESIVESV
jgi:chromosomal replication initiator protein